MGDRRTTIIDHSKPAGEQITSRSMVSLARAQIATEHVTNPEQLAATLNRLQDRIDSATLGTRTNPHSFPCIVRNVLVSQNTNIVIRHTLGRPFTGCHPVRQQGAPLIYSELPLAQWPPGITPSTAVVLAIGAIGAGGGTYDFAITGD